MTIDKLYKLDSCVQTHSAADRNLQRAFSELDRLKDKLSLSNAVVEKTVYIYRKAQEHRLLKGYTISTVLGTALYIAIRETGMSSMTLKDIAEVTGVEYKDLARAYRRIIMKFDLKIPVMDPMKYIMMMADNIGLGETTKRRAMDIMAAAMKDSSLSIGKKPMGLAAAALHMASLETGEGISLVNIVKVTGISEPTIRNNRKSLKSRLDGAVMVSELPMS